MYIISILIVIIANIGYSLFQTFIPDSVSPVIALLCMYFSGFIVANIFFIATREKKKKKISIKQVLNWKVFAFSVVNIMLDTGFLLAFRYGWEVSLLSVISNICILVLLTIIGVVFFKEKISKLNVLGLIIGIIGIVILNI